MELRHLRYFVAVAEELHFSRAAARLNIAAPTLSAQIQSLEAMLGAQLFTRKTRSVALTHVGKRFLDEARATLKQADQAEMDGRQAARGDIGSIAVGYVLSASCGGLVSQPIIEFKKSHPNVTDEDGSTPLIQAATHGKTETVKILIEAGADLNARDNDGCTALMEADEIEKVSLLLNAGADMSLKNHDGQTALSRAIENKDEEIVTLLKSRGAP